MQILYFAILWLLYCLLIPAALCCGIEMRPAWFRLWKWIFWIPALSAISWIIVVGAIAIPSFLGIFTPRGPELVFAIFFGWLYLWIAGIPVFLIYGVFRFTSGASGKKGLSDNCLIQEKSALGFIPPGILSRRHIPSAGKK